jgi:hypothetical protein
MHSDLPLPLCWKPFDADSLEQAGTKSHWLRITLVINRH